jgi:hypothetical protein
MQPVWLPLYATRVVASLCNPKRLPIDQIRNTIGVHLKHPRFCPLHMRPFAVTLGVHLRSPRFCPLHMRPFAVTIPSPLDQSKGPLGASSVH